MIQKLPTHGLVWKQVNDFSHEKEIVKKDKKGYIVEVDVDYPKELQKKQNELPFIAEKTKIGKVEKLVPHLKDKKTYAVHIKNLNQD